MSCSALASRSNARSRSSRENRAASAVSRSRSPSASSPIAGARRIDRQHHQVAHDARQLAADQPQVVARSRPRGRPARTRAAPSSSTTASIRSNSRSRPTSPSTVDDVVDGDRRPGERDHLIELALRVAHAAFGGARDQRQRRVGDLDLPRRRRSSAAARRSPWPEWSGTRRPATATGSCRESCRARSSPS